MDSATTTNPVGTKRVRIDPSLNTTHSSEQSTQKSRRKSPSAAAVDKLQLEVTSLPTALQDLLLYYGRLIIEIRSKIHNKLSVKKRMEEESDYIPKSARASDFKITLSKSTAAAISPERLDFLQQQVDQAKSMYQQSLKAVIQECTDHEIAQLKTEEKQCICNLLSSIAQATIKYSDHDCSCQQLVSNLLACHFDSIIKKGYLDVTTISFSQLYMRHHGIDDFPRPTNHISPTHFQNQEEMAQDTAAMFAANNRPENKILPHFVRALKCVLVSPWNSFYDQHEKNKKEVELKKLSTEIIEGKSTEETTMTLEEEPSANMEQLQDLIRKESEKREKRLEEMEKKCKDLENQLKTNSPKKGQQRGQQGASTKKKLQGNRKSRSPTPTQRNGQRGRNQTTNRSTPQRRGRSQESSNNSNTSGGNNRTRNQNHARNQNPTQPNQQRGQAGGNNNGGGRNRRSQPRSRSNSRSRRNRTNTQTDANR